MTITEQVSLAPLTTFKIGGPARYLATTKTTEDIVMALAYARERHVPWYVLGGGSNLLVHDSGYEGLIITPTLEGVTFEEKGTKVRVTAGAGVGWDTLVEETVMRGLGGLENLAGIPGTVGAAPVQNIGAYGVEIADTLESLEALNTLTNEIRVFTPESCVFSYRDSFFKHNRTWIITSVTFLLERNAVLKTEYSDVTARINAGTIIDSPQTMAEVVRDIRSQKFPDVAKEGTAGSFFKNPLLTAETYERVKTTFPTLPGFTMSDGFGMTKIPLAWILDHALHLKGFSLDGKVRLFERQPIVLVAQSGSSFEEVDALAKEVEKKVLEATGIIIEREVQIL